MNEAPTKSDLVQKLDALIGEVEPQAVAVRRHLHRHPELGWEEHQTQAFLKSWLLEQGIDAHPVANTGLWAQMGRGEGPVVYRADIDALPIHDAKQRGRAACVSENPGVCHACGHDLHTAVAAGLATVFKRLENDLPNPIRVVFQPAEETHPSGAKALIDDGGIDGARAAFALHCDPARDTGTVGLRVGALTSTADAYEIDVLGDSGHSARPHLASDAVLASAAVVQSLYSLVPQQVNPLEPAVLNIGRIHGGTAENVIAGKVVLTGVLRTLYADTRERMHKEIRRTAEQAANLHGCTADVRFRLGSPPIVNDESLHRYVDAAAHEVLGPSGVQYIRMPSTGAEDFGEFSVTCPTYMMRLGVRVPGHPTLHLHTPTFDVDERAIAVAMRVMGRALLEAAAA